MISLPIQHKPRWSIWLQIFFLPGTHAWKNWRWIPVHFHAMFWPARIQHLICLRWHWNTTRPLIPSVQSVILNCDHMSSTPQSGKLWSSCVTFSKWVPTFFIAVIFATDIACQILKDATMYFSRSTPNLATVIPAMDLLDEQLTNNSLNHARFNVSIRASLGVAKWTLNHYYNTDWSEVYRIAMGEFCL